MRYPQALIEKTGGVAAFAAKASLHPDAPRKLSRDAVYVWKMRNAVPFAWRMVVKDLSAQAADEDAA